MNGLANAVLFHIGSTGHPFAASIVVALLLVAHLRLFGTRREAIPILASAALGALAESALGLPGGSPLDPTPALPGSVHRGSSRCGRTSE